MFGELAPKSMAIQRPLPVTLWIAQPLEWFYKISFPAIWALNHTALWLLRHPAVLLERGGMESIIRRYNEAYGAKKPK